MVAVLYKDLGKCTGDNSDKLAWENNNGYLNTEVYLSTQILLILTLPNKRAYIGVVAPIMKNVIRLEVYT